MSVDEPVVAWSPRVPSLAPPLAPPDLNPAVITVTCLHDGHAHAVPDTELAGGADDSGYYRAVCGHVVSAAPMVEPDGKPCRECGEVQRPRRATSPRRLGMRLLGG